MICWRIDIQRNFSRYLHNELDRKAAEGIENHVLDCLSCRARLARLRDGHRFAQQMPRLRPERDVWAAIEAAIESDNAPAKSPARERVASRAAWSKFSYAQRLAAALAIILLVAAGLLLISDRREPDYGQTVWPAIAESFDQKEFHEVSISNIDKDGDLTFRLVEDLGRGEPFIVCEIIEPIRLEAPSVGSRVRVYGVSRYDDQENHRWHEVHPVLNIENVPR